jgi:hypothetical protein
MMLGFTVRVVTPPSPNVPTGGPLTVVYPKLLFQYICSHHPYLRPSPPSAMATGDQSDITAKH